MERKGIKVVWWKCLVIFSLDVKKEAGPCEKRGRVW